MVMERHELSFMISKLSCAIATTLQIKKTQLLELNEEILQSLFPGKEQVGNDQVTEDFILEKDFTSKMHKILSKFNGRFLRMEDRIDKFSQQIRQFRMPQYISINETFLGKYLILGILPYTQIYAEKLMHKSSCFIGRNLKFTSKEKQLQDFFSEFQAI